MAVNEQTVGVRAETFKAAFRIANFPLVVHSTSKVSQPAENISVLKANRVTSDQILKFGGCSAKVIVCWSLDRAGKMMSHSMLGVAVAYYCPQRTQPKAAAVLSLRLVNKNHAKSICKEGEPAAISDRCEGWYPHVHATRREAADGFVLLRDVLDQRAGWLAEGDVLTVECELKVTVSKVEPVRISSPSTSTNALQHLGEQFGSLLDTGRHSDVTIIVDTQRFHAHSLILMARSPVFEAMWTHAMKEKEEKVVTITDVDAATMSTILNFMYKGEFNIDTVNDNETASLLRAAHKYQIPVLVDLCVSRLTSHLTKHNAIEFLELADLIGLESMKKTCLGIMTATSDMISDIQATEGFKGLATKRPHLLADILSSAFPPTKAARKE